jgi:hypothetical protein
MPTTHVRRDLVVAAALWASATALLATHLWLAAEARQPLHVTALWVSAHTLPWLLAGWALLLFLPGTRRPALFHLVTAPAVVLGQPLLQYALMIALRDLGGVPVVFGMPEPMSMLRGKLPVNLVTYAAMAAVVHLLLQRRRELQLHLRTLEGRLQPHFLFNSIHSVVALIDEDPEAARAMLVRLSDLLRLTISRGGEQVVALRDEVRWCEAYLAIERVRFEDRLEIDVRIDPDLLDARVPAMILQPLVENAVKHGIAASENGGTVHIRGAAENRVLSLEVETMLRSPAAVTPAGLGIGLETTRSRLALLYASRAAVEFRAEPQRSTVRLTLPAGAAS